MTRRTCGHALTLSVVLCLLGCQEKPATSDAAAAAAVYPQLHGAWFGTQLTNDHGQVVVNVFVSRRAVATGTIAAQGFSWSGSATISRYDGGRGVVSYQGTDYEFSATRQSDTLTVSASGLGEITLRKNQK